MASTPRFVTVQLDINTPEIRALLERTAHEAFRAGFGKGVVAADDGTESLSTAADQAFADWLIYGPGVPLLKGEIK